MSHISLNHILNIASSAMNAETVRLSTIASNLANAEVAGTIDTVYQARKPVFATVFDEMGKLGAKVQIVDVIISSAPPRSVYEPDHPLADEEGHVFYPNISAVEEMTDMLSSSRAFQTNVEIFNRTLGLQQAALKMLEG